MIGKRPTDQLQWLPEGYEPALKALIHLRDKRASSVLSSDDARDLDRGTRDQALWHRLFGEKLPLQALARPYQASFPPNWRAWERPSTSFNRHAFDALIEEALKCRGEAWNWRQQHSGVQCIYLEVRAEIRRWFLTIERAHSDNVQRQEIVEKLEILLSSSSTILGAMDEMRGAISYLSNLKLPHDDDDVGVNTKIWELFDQEVFEDRFEGLEEYLDDLEHPTRRYATYYSPKEETSHPGENKRPGRKKGVGVNIRRRLFGINAMTLFAFLKGSFPGEGNGAFENFLSDLEYIYFADEDTEASLPTEVPPVNRKDIRSLASRTVWLLKDVDNGERTHLIPKDFEDLTEVQARLRELFEKQIWNTWEETAPLHESDPCEDTLGPT
ncbi:hypothetical protein [Roseibium sp. MMSF_3412]|uniref:hypothetical protein n=1 Tax=Roseibium sp. MMSF_3412 TaxID=3046712 RepID=UPI00273D812B|nr:hypothetical protein [Roseibium sp. MMSF_3412]